MAQAVAYRSTKLQPVHRSDIPKECLFLFRVLLDLATLLVHPEKKIESFFLALQLSPQVKMS